MRKTLTAPALGVIVLTCLMLAACAVTGTPAQEPAAEDPAVYAAIEQPPLEPTQAPTQAPTPDPTATPIPEPTPFSFAWISDTQAYTAKDSDVFGTMTQWIADTQDEYNTVLTLHTGDIVYNAYQDYQWQNSVAAFARLPEGMHIVTAQGNHDQLRKEDPHTPYLDNRPDTDFDLQHAFDPEGYTYYTTFTEGGVPFLVFSLSYGMEVTAADWINEICGRYADHYAVLCLHNYIDTAGYTSVGRRLIEKVVMRSPNIRLVVCGHAHGSVYKPEAIDDDGDGAPDRTVHQMIFNVQDDGANAVGFLRILRFDPKADTIEVITYSPCLQKFGYEDRYGDHFGESRILEDAGLDDFITDGTAQLH